ncbi:hypothetical protein NQ315_014478, partial [Exocentrus adspersus]
DLTKEERKIQKTIREKAKQEKEKGNDVKVGYQKLVVNGKVWKWNKLAKKSPSEGNKGLKIGTWNVKATFEEGKLKHLVNEVERCNFDILSCATRNKATRGISNGSSRRSSNIVQLLPEARNQATEKTRNSGIAWLRTKEEKAHYERNLKVELEAISNNTGENKTIEEAWGDIKTKMEVTANLYQGVKNERRRYQPKPVFYKDTD